MPGIRTVAPIEPIERSSTEQRRGAGSGRGLWHLALAAALSIGLVGCGDDGPSTPQQPTPSTAQLANPASVYCEDQGGEVEIVDEAEGQVGYCLLPDGRRVEEWELFRSETGTTVP